MDWRARRAPSPAVLAFLMMGELDCAAGAPERVVRVCLAS